MKAFRLYYDIQNAETSTDNGILKITSLNISLS